MAELQAREETLLESLAVAEREGTNMARLLDIFDDDGDGAGTRSAWRPCSHEGRWNILWAYEACGHCCSSICDFAYVCCQCSILVCHRCAEKAGLQLSMFDEWESPVFIE